jgi:WD40 repeat protein/transcriptional regulator with XRE-family HTH domain
VKRYSYRERDYGFGQRMLTLRMHIGLTQAGLAQLLHINRRAVAAWEAGSSYPKADHLKELITLGVRASAFADGREEEEIRALWKAAHQKVLLDESWLQRLLGTKHPRLVLVEPQSDEQTNADEQAVLGPRVDWGEALDVPSFYGREGELALLSRWVVEERCRVVSVLGLGGIGKSALVVTLMHQVAPHFEAVIWRSLRDAPECCALLDDCLQVLAPESLREVPISLERRLGLLLEYLREGRVLLVLDNLEVLLEEGTGMGRVRTGYEDYAHLLRRVAQTAHQSCLLLTSREKASDLEPLEGGRSPVRSLRLEGLDTLASAQLLLEKDVSGTPPERERLIELYGGNPLALKIVAQTIVDLFGSEITLFLEQGEVVFGGVRELLDEQFARLSADEQTVLLWLAILREPVSIEEVLAALATPLSRAQVLEAVVALRRRSLVERGQRQGSFTLQSVVLEYATRQLIAETTSEIEQGRLTRLIEHGLALAGAREYVRQTQQRLLVAPLLAQLRNVYLQRAALEQHLLAQLVQLRAQADYAQGYGPANALALLHEHWGHLRGLNLSQLAIRGAFLQRVEMQDTTLAGATVRDTAFTETFSAIWAVAISNDGQYWAAGSGQGEVWVWEAGGKTLHLVWQAHMDTIRALSFNPDGRSLASGSDDGLVKLWDLESGALLWTSWQTKSIENLAFAPDGRTLASGGDDAVILLWDAFSGTQLQTLTGHAGSVFALAWSPDGRLLASAGFDRQIRLWKMQEAQPETSVRMLEGHTNWVLALTFAPNGRTLASASWDRTVKLWDVDSLRVRQTLTGHTDHVFRVAWSPDGRLLASSGQDQTIWLWDVERSSYRTALHGHTAIVSDIVFMPDNRSLLSGSDDGTVRVWDVENGQCVRIMQGHAAALYDVAWSPDGTQLASAGRDLLVTIWDMARRIPLRVLRGHSWIVSGVAWSPDGRLLASSGWDNSVRVWDASTGESRQTLRDPDVETLFYSVEWSPNGKFLASGSYQRGVQVWEVATGTRWWVSRGQLTKIRRVAWSPNGTRLASGGDDGSLCLWGDSDGTLLAKLQGHRGLVMSVAWSPDGTRLASGGGSSGKGELFVWDAPSGERLYTLNEPSAVVHSLAWGPTGAMLISGGSDGKLRWWDVRRGECVRVQQAHQGTVQALKVSPDGTRLASCGDDGAIMLWDLHRGEHLQTLRRDRPYERLNITGIRGLSEAQKASLRALGAFEETSVSG